MKSKPSKLDSHETELAEWFRRDKLTLAQAVARLGDRQVKVSASRLSAWWAKYQSDEMTAEAETKLYADLASGSRIAKEVGAMAANAPTQAGTLVKLIERLILQISVRGDLPNQTEVLPALVRSALDGMKVQQAERSLAIDEAKLHILQSKAAKAEAAEKIAGDDSTSPEEKAQKIRAVFGMS